MRSLLRCVPLALLVACADSGKLPTESASSEATPNFNFANGPPELFNVIRFSTDFIGFSIIDEKTGLIAVEGFVGDPKSAIACGGTNASSPLTWQQVGLLRDVIHNHVVGKDVGVGVYRLSDFDPNVPGDPIIHLFCTATPIALGTGRFSAVDNDAFGTSGKNNAVTETIRGTVTDLLTGELLRLEAGFHVVQNLAGFPDVPPTVKVFNTVVRLHPVGGP
jgi:hypothetical protein